MLAHLMLRIARHRRGRDVLRALASRGVFLASVENALAAEIVEASSSQRQNAVLPALLEPRVSTALLRLLAVVEHYSDDLPASVVGAASSARSIESEWNTRPMLVEADS